VKACRGIRRCLKGLRNERSVGSRWRRHDYNVDIFGVAPGFNYASDCRDVDGIVFPTKRRVYAHEVERQPVNEPLLVKIDMAEITLA